MIKSVLFDLDGTLLNTTEGILESAHHAISQMGWNDLSYSEMCSFVGPPIQVSFKAHYNCSDEEAQRAAEFFRDYYKTNALYKAKVYDGVYLLCEKLKESDFNLGVATYKREDYALTILEHFGFSEYCSVMHGADNMNKLKKADIVEMCIKRLGTNRKDCVLVGDTIHDAIGAMTVGIPFIAVTYGFGFKNKKDVQGYDCIGVASSPMEVYEIINQFNSN